MGLLGLFRRINRHHWHVCYDCMQRNDHDPLRSVFYYDGPPAEIHGRQWVKCLRCDGINTRSFQFLKDDGAEAQLWGLERIVRSHPRSAFEVKRSA